MLTERYTVGWEGSRTRNSLSCLEALTANIAGKNREPHIQRKAKGTSKTETQNSRALTAARSYPQCTHRTGAMKQKQFKTNTTEENHAEKLFHYMQIKIWPFPIHLEHECVLLLTHFKFIITAWWKVQGKAEKKSGISLRTLGHQQADLHR